MESWITAGYAYTELLRSCSLRNSNTGNYTMAVLHSITGLQAPKSVWPTRHLDTSRLQSCDIIEPELH